MAWKRRINRILRDGDEGDDAKLYQREINARNRIPGKISVDGFIGPKTLKAAEKTAEILGIYPFKGTTAAAWRRQDVITGAPRTNEELNRARRLRPKPSKKPKIVVLNAPMTSNQGSIGGLTGTIGHYTAGPRDTSDSHAIALFKQYNAQHRRQGWGAIGYHYGITKNGTIVCLRPVSWRGTHTAGANTGRVGIVVHGSLGQRMTKAQHDAYTWLLRNAHTTAMPSKHRASSSLINLSGVGRVHNDYNATSCPGNYKADYRKTS